jgi:hypothetical protein
MAFGLSGWRPRHLLASWVVYWAAVVAVKLSPAIAAAWRVSRQGEHGTISAGFQNDVLHLTMTDGTATVWEGTTQFGTAMLWVAGPPLLLWLVWLLTRRRPDAARHDSFPTVRTVERMTPRAPADSRALGEGPAPGAPVRRDTPAPRQYDDRRIR